MPMPLLGQEASFWITVGIAASIKALLSRFQTLRAATASMAAAVFVPWLFTDAVLDWMNWDRQTYLLPTAGLLAWLGEQWVRALLGLNLEKLARLAKELRS